MTFIALQTGVSGLQSEAAKMQVIGNNLANVNTTGFKKDRASFRDLFYQTIQDASSGDKKFIGGTNAAQIGLGVRVASIDPIFTQGAQLTTTRPLDFMIQGNDFFVAQSVNDQSLMLSRNGTFTLDGNSTLVDALGNKIMGFNVDPETGAKNATAGQIKIPLKAIKPNATTDIAYSANIDSSTPQLTATAINNAWELFAAGDDFGQMKTSIINAGVSPLTYGGGHYQDSFNYTATNTTIASPTLTTTSFTLGAVPANLALGFKVNDLVSYFNGAGNQAQGTVTGVVGNTVTIGIAMPTGFVAGPGVTLTNMSNGSQRVGSSGAAAVHNDVLRSQISMIDSNGKLIASFYHVQGPAAEYTRATENLVGGGAITTGSGEFTTLANLKDLMARALTDSQLTNVGAGSVPDLDAKLDKFNVMSFKGSGLAQSFRLVINDDNTALKDYFTGFTVSDSAALAVTQARIDPVTGLAIAAPALALGPRAANSSKTWYNVQGYQNYGYSNTNPQTQYGEFAGLRLDGGADGHAFGIVELSLKDALGQTQLQQYKLVARDPDSNQNQFSTMGELAQLIQTSLRQSQFSSIAQNGAKMVDNTASAALVNGRLTVSTLSGKFKNLVITVGNKLPDPNSAIFRTDEMNFGTVLGELSRGVNGKQGISNTFIQADATSQTTIYDNNGNQHASMSYFVHDRSSGLANIEWKFKAGLNPNLNSIIQEATAVNDPRLTSVYRSTYDSLQDTTNATGTLAFDINTGRVLSSASDPRYKNVGDLSFQPQQHSVLASPVNAKLDFSNLTSFNGANTVVSSNTDGYGIGNLVRITSENNTGAIQGIYSNGQTRSLALIGLMSMMNPTGLEKMGSSYYKQTPNSSANGQTKGLDQIFAVGVKPPDGIDSVHSTILSSSLESSNVDVTQELTDMITTQRSYSASSKVITTSDQMLQEALNLKQ